MKTHLNRIRDGLLAESYFAVANSSRFRAAERRQLQHAARAGMVVVMFVAVVGGLLVSRAHEDRAPLVLGLDGSVGLLAGGAFLLLGRRLRHQPEPIVFVVATGVVFASVALGVAQPDLAVLASGYLLLVPVVVSQVVTWRTWTHTLWLLVYMVALLAFISLAPISDLSPLEKVDVAVLGLIAFAASFTGHVLGIRTRIRSFDQFRTIQSLHRRMEGQARELAAALADLERTSRVDPLTRVANRLRLDEDFEEVRAGINRTGGTFGLVEADLDRFKSVNDQLGHLAGDAVLRSVAQALNGALRSGDHLYRYGGEEFIALIADADATATQAAAERLRAAVEALAIAHPEPQLGVVTVSIGGTVVGPADIDATDGVLFNRADRAMYVAKTSGRNRIAMELPDWYAERPVSVLVAADGTA